MNTAAPERKSPALGVQGGENGLTLFAVYQKCGPGVNPYICWFCGYFRHVVKHSPYCREYRFCRFSGQPAMPDDAVCEHFAEVAP